MDYQVLALKYRPGNFDEVVGQAQVTDVLKGALEQDRIAKAYIFSGPRGCGKTSSARILAKALNCAKGPTPSPCGECESCQSIAKGSNLAVIEIDAASTGGVQDIRDMREEAALASIGGRYKIYILDEAHQISTAGNNALLKTLEEPPPNTVFILATTEPQKMLPTVHSRCQHYQFRLLSVDDIAHRLGNILKWEKIEVEADVLQAIARRADGSMRDGMTLMDQVLASCEGKLTLAQVTEILGLTSFDHLFSLTEAILARDGAAALRELHRILDGGLETREFALGLSRYFRNLLLIKLDPTLLEAEMIEEDRQRCCVYAESFQVEDLLYLSRIVGERADKIRYASQPRVLLETLVVEISRFESRILLSEILTRLRTLGGGQGTGSPTAGADSRNEQKRGEGSPRSAPVTRQTTGTGRRNPMPPPPEPAASPASTPQVDFKGDPGEVWGTLCQIIGNEQKSIGSFLERTRPGRLTEKKLIVYAENTFAMSMLDTSDNLLLLSNKFADLTGCKVEMCLELASSEEKPEPERISKEHVEDTRRTQDLKEYADNEVVGDLLKRFDGEIVED
ncbi:MAG: DNA polymerase III subunit gamma/tau [bacterium]|nr:DNA polymerase III subunit gamma/tau [bacterium]